MSTTELDDLFASNEAAEEEGVWVDVSPTIKLKIRAYSADAVNNLREKLIKPFRTMIRAGGSIPEEQDKEIGRKVLAGAVIAIGNAPTALFHLLEMLVDPACPRPAAIIGCPVGFVGAAESKSALWDARPAPAIIVEGRLGGSAITVAAVNAIASRSE